MKEIVVTNGLRVRSEGIAAPHKSIRLSGIKKSIQEKIVFIFVVVFLMCCLFFFIVQVRVSQYIYYFCSGFGHDASQNVAKSVLTEENFCSMLKWKT